MRPGKGSVTSRWKPGPVRPNQSPAANLVQTGAILNTKRRKRGSRDSIERRNFDYLQADVVDLTEGNTTIRDMVSGWELQRRQRPIHAVQSYTVNWGEPTVSAEACDLRYA